MTTQQVNDDDRRLSAEADAAEQRERANKAEHQLMVLRAELERARIRCGQLERQLANYDEDEFDPSKQKGVGGIPVGGPDMTEVEAIEARLGMSPTLDQQLKQLGLGSPGAPLLSYESSLRAKCSGATIGKALQVLWCARAAMMSNDQGRMWSAVQQIQLLPIAWFEEYLDLDSWDEQGLPSLKDKQDG